MILIFIIENNLFMLKDGSAGKHGFDANTYKYTYLYIYKNIFRESCMQSDHPTRPLVRYIFYFLTSFLLAFWLYRVTEMCTAICIIYIVLQISIYFTAVAGVWLSRLRLINLSCPVLPPPLAGSGKETLRVFFRQI